jgi:single-stranded-DNA-specific exonuclease
MTVYRWQPIPTDENVVQKLHAATGLDPLFCRLLAQRGLGEAETARRFLEIRLDDLHNPFQMADMQVAVERLDRALKKGERILLYGDYDVDGTTSVTLMYAFLSGFYRNLDYYLPDRDKEGYGVSLQSVEYARENGAKRANTASTILCATTTCRRAVCPKRWPTSTPNAPIAPTRTRI